MIMENVIQEGKDDDQREVNSDSNGKADEVEEEKEGEVVALNERNWILKL